MIKSILLDMDNTLLVNPDSVFVSHYLTCAEAFFREHLTLTNARQILTELVKPLGEQRSGTQSNLMNIIHYLQNASGHSEYQIIEAINTFNQTIYPSLSTLIQPLPIAPKLIQLLREQEISLVLATNPVYAESAIRQRMAWGLLPDDKNTFALITHAGNMHFAKPDPAYYAEVIARVGIEPDEALMVGDSFINDITAAQSISLNTYHIGKDGTLDDFFKLIQQPRWRDTFQSKPLNPTMINHELRGNIGALFGLLSDTTREVWTLHPDPQEWSIVQIVCHLLQSEQNHHRPRLEQIKREENPFIVAPKPIGLDMSTCGDNPLVTAQAFALERQKTLDWLTHCTESDWHRPARHSIFGLTTLLEMAHFTAQHDRLHINQLCQTIGRCQ